MISAVVAGFSLVKSFFQMSSEEKKAKSLEKREAVKAKRAENQQRESNLAAGEASMADLDAITLKQIGWLDDFVVLVTLTPLLASFMPIESVQVHVQAAMNALDNMPQWYQYAVAAVFTYTLGFKSLVYRLLVKRGI
ncbi:hypothetical protein [Vibrio sonorensis]|uniref:hypothetical protein n=1 Tax=Vibrio sonorensis TaxID=1004316 RepID=UPI0008DA900C|nr:hypothetical protein [Vibrio sonorensis]